MAEDTRGIAETAISGVVLIFIIISAIIGNILVIAIILLNRKLKENVSSMFIINLSITDLFSALCVMIPSLYGLLADKREFQTGWCELVCAANYCCIIVSMLTLSFISIERFFAIMKPLRYPAIVTRKKILASIIYSWCQGIAFAAAPVGMKWIHYDYWEVVCAIDWLAEQTQAVYYVIVACILCFVLPACIMVGSYCSIIREVRQSKIIPGISSTDQAAAKAMANNTKIIRSLIIIVIIFFICMTPFCVTKLLKVLSVPVSNYANLTASFFEYVSSATNPLIYGIFRPEFRRAYKRLFWRWCSLMCCDRYCTDRQHLSMSETHPDSIVYHNHQDTAQPVDMAVNNVSTGGRRRRYKSGSNQKESDSSSSENDDNYIQQSTSQNVNKISNEGISPVQSDLLINPDLGTNKESLVENGCKKDMENKKLCISESTISERTEMDLKELSDVPAVAKENDSSTLKENVPKICPESSSSTYLANGEKRACTERMFSFVTENCVLSDSESVLSKNTFHDLEFHQKQPPFPTQVDI